MKNLKTSAKQLASYGRNGDTLLAHINPQEAQLLSLLGGSGTINPDTGLPEFFFKAVTNFISKAIGTDGSGGGLLGRIAKIDPGPAIGKALADIDPGPAIGSGLAEVDKFVNREIPGGWITVGAAAATAGAAAGGAFGGGVAAGSAGTAAGGAAGGAAAGTGLTGGLGGSAGILGGTTASGLAGAGTAAGIASTQAAAGLGLSGGSALASGLGATGAGLSGVGGLSAASPAAGGIGGAGAGLSAQLAPGTILGTGLPGGGAIGSSYMLGANSLPAVGAFGQLVPASSISFGGQAVPAGSLSVKDALDIARLGRNLIGQQPQAQQAQQQARPRANTMPQGSVDYSGILNLLQARSPQLNPNSLLG
jgi:hypothetical protein